MKALRSLLVWICFVAILPLQAATVPTQLDRDTIMMGDSATFQLRFENVNPQTPPVFPAPANLSIQFAGQGSQYSIVNGRTSSAIILSYTVSASQPGTYVIPAVNVPVGGTTLTTQPLRLTVTKDESGGSAVTGGQVFIRLQVAKTNAYVGELIPIQVNIYGKLIHELQIPTLKSDGFVIGAQAQGQPRREQIGNDIYTIYPFQMTVAPAKAGTLTLGPAESTMIIRVQTPGRRRDVFEEVFGGSQTKQVTIASDSATIQVLPLPAENRPPTFNGAIGNFQLVAKATPTNVMVGDPISLQVQVQGRGSFDTVRLPEFGWKDFTFYQPNTTTTNSDQLGTRAVKYFDQVIVPQRAGIAAIPSIAFSFFDPEAHAYRTLTQPAIPISVKATGHGPAQPTIVADQGAQVPAQTAGNDIVHIKASLGNLAVVGAPLAVRPGFIALQLLPVGLWLAAVGWRKQKDRLTNDPRLRRQREVSKNAAELLSKLREDAVANRSEEFFATAFRLLQEQLGERLDVPAAAITEAILDEKLPKLGASAELLATLRDLFQSCNQARYAGASVAGMEAMIATIERALTDIKKLPHVGGSK